jgi:hypothetical protein
MHKEVVVQLHAVLTFVEVNGQLHGQEEIYFLQNSFTSVLHNLMLQSRWFVTSDIRVYLRGKRQIVYTTFDEFAVMFDFIGVAIFLAMQEV